MASRKTKEDAQESVSIREDVAPDAQQKEGDDMILQLDQRRHAELALKRTLDLRVLPMVFLILIMNYIDRTAITSARLKGLESDLKISDIQYDTIIAVLYVTYSPTQIPLNLLIGKVSRPSRFIGACVILWGLISTLTGITQNFPGMLSCRLALGLPEAALYPGIVYLLSRWYTRKEVGLRIAVFHSGLILANAFGGLMAAGVLSHMEGKEGVRAWRWLFFIEGAITMTLGIFCLFILPDYPHNTRWMDAKVRRLAQARVAKDAGESDADRPEETIWKGFTMSLRDPLVWLFTAQNFTQLLGLSFVNFFPTLTSTLGFSTSITLLLTAPPWIFGAIMCLLAGRHADATGERFFHVGIWMWAVILGYVISLSTFATGARYASLFLMAAGYAGVPITFTWLLNSIPRPPIKRAASVGILNGVGSLGYLVGAFVWKASWGPQYHQSMVIALSSLVMSTIFAFIIRQMLLHTNRRLDREELGAITEAHGKRIEEFARLEGITLDEARERKKGFRYLY